MIVVHFISGAADPLTDFGATGAHFVPLMEGQGDSHISCVHLQTGAKVTSPSLTHAAALLCVHGRITIAPLDPPMRIDIHAGMGCVLDVMPSTGSVGEAYDNAMAESFFASLEREVLDRRRFKSHAVAKMAIFEWIEGWQNRIEDIPR